MIISTIFNFFSPFLPLDQIMNLVGSLLCFFFVYLIPSKFHWDCLYNTISPPEQSLISSSEEAELVKCPHSNKYSESCPRPIRKYFYIFLNFVGVSVAIYGLYQFFSNIFSGWLFIWFTIGNIQKISISNFLFAFIVTNYFDFHIKIIFIFVLV